MPVPGTCSLGGRAGWSGSRAGGGRAGRAGAGWSGIRAGEDWLVGRRQGWLVGCTHDKHGLRRDVTRMAVVAAAKTGSLRRTPSSSVRLAGPTALRDLLWLAGADPLQSLLGLIPFRATLEGPATAGWG